ncbi:ANTAR domain-containing protein [Streptomyces sp. SS7]|uniref:ANTAR domain-containing protein n=1 Tax=Streptomyces sp. SS7 TaxID=3108485 RepID=UPI0030EF6D50
MVLTGPDGDRVVVTVSGEYRLDHSQYFRRCARDALARSTEGIDLDLGGLTFADSSALNVLLAVRGQALADEKTVAVTAVSPAAERLLSFTDTYTLFSAGHGTAEQGGDTEGTDTEEELLRTELVQLRRAMRTRPDIDLARGILMAAFGLDADEAWEVLVTASQHTNTKLHRLARDVVATVRGAALPEPVRREITATIARARRGHVRPPGGTGLPR